MRWMILVATAILLMGCDDDAQPTPAMSNQQIIAASKECAAGGLRAKGFTSPYTIPEDYVVMVQCVPK